MSQWVMAGADDNDPTFSPGNELWGIPALRSRDVWINLDLLRPSKYLNSVHSSRMSL